MAPRTSREDLLSQPRSGARPLFAGESTGETRPRPARSPGSARHNPRSSGGASRASGPGRAPSPRPSTPSGGAGRAISRSKTPRSAATRTYAEHITRERTRRTQSDYRRAARAQVSAERGERPARTGPGTRQRVNRAASYARSGRQLQPSFHNYQGIVIAEFLAATGLVVMTPIASRQNVPGLSPYIPRDMTKLLALGLVYFLLSLLTIGGGAMARISAWTGGLILLTVGLNEGANVAKNLDIFDDVKNKVTGRKKPKPEPVGTD